MTRLKENKLPPLNPTNIGDIKEKISAANEYTVTLNIFPDTYSASASSILECLKKMRPTRWGKGISSISIEHHGKKYESQLHLTPWRWRMIFEKPVNMEFFVKRLKTRI